MAGRRNDWIDGKGKEMRRLLIGLGLALLAWGAAAAGASATHSAGEDPKHDFVTGTGERQVAGFPDRRVRVHVNAKSGSSSEDPQGSFFIKGEGSQGQIDVRGSITCLTVEGNRALAGGVIERSDNPGSPNYAEGRFVVMQVVDNGEPGDRDTHVFISGFEALPSDCGAARFSPLGGVPVDRGNYVVHDARAS